MIDLVPPRSVIKAARLIAEQYQVGQKVPTRFGPVDNHCTIKWLVELGVLEARPYRSIVQGQNHHTFRPGASANAYFFTGKKLLTPCNEGSTTKA